MGTPIEKNKKNYMEYVQKRLKKYKVNDPSKVPNKHKKKFFQELDKGWESKEEKKKASITKAVTALLAKESSLEGFTMDWKKSLERTTKGILSGLACNNSSSVKTQVAILRRSCDDLDLLLEDFGKKASKQPPKDWRRIMRVKVKSDSPEYSEEALDKVVGDIWYNKMSPDIKEEIVKKFEDKTAGIDAGAIHIKNKDEKKALGILKDNGILVKHTEDVTEGEKTLFMDVKYIERASVLLKEEGVASTRSH